MRHAPDRNGRALTERVAAGDYASESEVARNALRTSLARDESVETWLRSEVTAYCDELRADSSRGISPADLRAHLAGLRPTRDGTLGATRRVLHAPRAQLQLTELLLWIAERSDLPDRAQDLDAAIIKHCDGLSAVPVLGRARGNLRPRLRAIGFRRRVVIAFVVHEDAVEIHGVLCGGQDYDTDLPNQVDCPIGSPLTTTSKSHRQRVHRDTDLDTAD